MIVLITNKNNNMNLNIELEELKHEYRHEQIKPHQKKDKQIIHPKFACIANLFLVYI